MKKFNIFNTLFVALIVSAGSTQLQATPDFDWDLQSYYSHASTKLDEVSITSQMLYQMNYFDTAYDVSETYPSGSGLSSAELQEVQNLISGKYSIVRDSDTAILTGRAIVMDSESAPAAASNDLPASFNGDWVPDVNKIISYYAKTSIPQRPALLQAYLDMVELYLNHNVLPGSTDPIPSTGNGYVWRNNTWKVLRMCHTLPEQEKNLFALSIYYYSGGGLLLQDTPHSSTDIYYNIYPTAFYAVSRMTDDAFKWQLLNTIRQQLDKTIIGTDGTDCLISIDGGVYHHWGHHIAYVSYSFPNMVKPHRVLCEAGITSPLTAEAIKRFRKAAIVWSWTDTNGYFPVHFLLRPTHPSVLVSGGKNLGNTVYFLRLASELTAAYLYGDSSQIADDLELAYPAIVKAGYASLSLPVAWQNINLPQQSSDPKENWTNLIQGHHTFQTMGAAIHRRDNWMASVRGAHNYRRGGEGYDAMGRPDHFHVNSMRGSLLLITEGKNGRMPNSADSGYFYEGWDHNCYPNVTAQVVDMDEYLYWRTPAYFDGKALLTGGADLFDNGLWFYVPTAVTQRKSVFFFDNRITLVTSDINYDNDPDSIVTGLIQQGHPDFANSPITLDGNVINTSGQWDLAVGGNHTIVDINGNGYYIHPGAPEIKISRNAQQWTYGLSEYYTGPGSMPSYTYKNDFIDDVNSGYFIPSSANYTKIYFDHGTNPTNDSLAYTVFVKPQNAQLDEFFQSMNTPGAEPFTLDTTNDHHLLYDIASNTYAVAAFTDNQTINQGGLISVNRAGAYMWKNDGQTKHVSCGSSYMDNTEPFIMVFQGSWELIDQYDTDGPTLQFDSIDNTTTVMLPYLQFARQAIVLEQATNNPPVFTLDPIFGADVAVGDIYNASLIDYVSDIDDGDIMSFSILSGPDWLTVHENGGLSGTPTLQHKGTNCWVIQVQDSSLETDLAILCIKVPDIDYSNTVMAFDFDDPDYDSISELINDGWVFTGEDGSNAPILPAQYGITYKNNENTLKLDGQDRQDGTDYEIKPSASYTFAPVVKGEAAFRYSNSNSYCSGYMRFYNGTTELFAVKMTSKDKISFQGSTNTSDFFLPGFDNQLSPVTVILSWENGSFTFDAGLDNNGQPIQGTLDFKTDGDVDRVTYTMLTNNNDSREIYLYDIAIFDKQCSENNLPEFTSEEQSLPVAKINKIYSALIAAIDIDSDPITYSKLSGPDWLNIEPDGSLHGIAGVENLNENIFVFLAHDNKGGLDFMTVQLNVYYQGDINLDNSVDIVDLNILLNNWLEPSSSADIYPYLDADGIVNLMDYAALQEYWLIN
ncbi:MAG: hypothetical protein JEZ07_17120 [Phycisphaerae bacterium]|nr:hypothetical protein [Phycisphaerae bacterium]